jgi:hypothetical protein
MTSVLPAGPFSGSFHIHTRSGLSRMDAIAALASWPNSIDEIAHAVAHPDSPPTTAEIRDVGGAIGAGNACIIVNGHQTNLRRTQHVILGCLPLVAIVQKDDDGSPVILKKVMSYSLDALLRAGTALVIVLLVG